MTVASDEFIRRFLIHVLPPRFHRIRYYGLFANATRARNLLRARKLLDVPTSQDPDCENDEDASLSPWRPCPSCGGIMRVIDTFEPGDILRATPSQSGVPP